MKRSSGQRHHAALAADVRVSLAWRQSTRALAEETLPAPRFIPQFSILNCSAERSARRRYRPPMKSIGLMGTGVKLRANMATARSASARRVAPMGTCSSPTGG